MITSRENPKVRKVIQLQTKSRERLRHGLFVVEGLRSFAEVPKEALEQIFVSEPFLQDDEKKAVLTGAGIGYEVVSERVFLAMSDTKTPQGILAVVRRPAYGLAELLCGERSHILILENIQDPGNLGTMFRTAEGAGATGIVLNEGCVDLFSPKTVRATMGSIFRVPFVVAPSLPAVIGQLKQEHIEVYAAHLKGTKDYDRFDYRKGTAFLIGNEGNGLNDETAALADSYLRIPMGGQLESLNAAMAAGILMYEAARQRRQDGNDCPSEA